MTGHPKFTIVQPTNHYRRVRTGEFWRDYVARRSDGALRLITCRDDSLSAGMVAA
jgi:hypothetical protein